MEREERARLGSDYCLSAEGDPRCAAHERHEYQRSKQELKSYCGKNPDAPRCLATALDPKERITDVFDARDVNTAGVAKPRDDFFEPPQSDGRHRRSRSVDADWDW